MTATPNLNLAHLLNNSDQPEVMVNALADLLDTAFNAARAWTITGNTTATQDQLAEGFLHVLGGTPAGAFDFNLPAAVERNFAVHNDSGQTATVQVTGGGGLSIDVEDGEVLELHSDGTDVLQRGYGAPKIQTVGAFMGALVRKAADQTTANYSTPASIAFDQESHDSDGFHDNSTNNERLTIPDDLGITKVVITANVHMSLISSGSDATLRLLKNGSADFDGAAGVSIETPADAIAMLSLTAGPLTVADGDYFELELTCTDVSVTVTALNTMFGLQVVEVTGGIHVADIQAEASTSWQLALSHIGALVQANNGSAITLTIPANATIAWPIGAWVRIAQWGAGAATLTEDGGVTLRSRPGPVTNGQYAECLLTKVGTDEWLASGDLTT
jgi:hypothetical protein